MTLINDTRPVPGGAVGPNPTDRAKAGSKRSVLVDGSGGPLSVVVAGANVHDTKLLALTLEAIVVERPGGIAEGIQKRDSKSVFGQRVRQPNGPPSRVSSRVSGTHSAHQGGKTGRRGRETLSGAAMGWGARLGLVVQVSCDFGSL